MNDRAPEDERELQQVLERLRELESRVAALEAADGLGAAAPAPFLGRPTEQKETPTQSISAVPVLGKAVLAISGAYLLRAIAESGAVPERIMLLAGIVYAGFWLVWAVRSHRRSRFAGVVFGLTTAAILGPLLWEGTVRFQQLSPGFASGVLVALVALSLGLAWKERLETIPWIETLAAVATAVALIVATRELRAVAVAFVAMALLIEAAACSGRWLGLRAVTALAADFVVGLLGIVMTSADGVPPSYRALSAGEVNGYCIALMLVYGGSLVVRGLVLRRKLTFAETAQAAVALVIGTWVSLRATHGESGLVLGAAFMTLAALFYWGALIRLARPETQRNRRVAANFAAGLMLAATSLLLAGDSHALALSLAAVAAFMVSARAKYLSIGLHGAVYLLAAGIVAGLFRYQASAMMGTVPAWPAWSLWVVASAGLVSYVVSSQASRDGWRTRVLCLVPAAVVAGTLAAALVAGIAGLTGSELTASRLSMARTAVTCLLALGLGYTGSRWNRVELGWVAYGAIGLGALKLMLEDLRFGSAGTLVVSLLFYGLILILLPRLTRFGRVEV
jgi:hypothetical protein